MSNGPLHTIIRQLRKLAGPHGAGELTDAQLLDRFVSQHDEAAFEVLVWRHGTMVLNVCQRVLRDAHAAEDAFQATFLVFVRKAGSIGKRESVGSWLYQVAYRIALRFRTSAAKRAGHVQAGDDLPAREAPDDVVWRDLRPVLDEEIHRLPEKYRAPFVLCYLQGHTNEEAAQQLGCPRGTILSRLAHGRDRLRSRLARRGVALSTGSLAVVLSQNLGSAAVPAPLVSCTIKAATLFAAGKAATGLIAADVTALAEGVLKAMFLTKLKITVAALLTLSVLGTGAGLLAQRVPAERPAVVPADRAAATQRGERAAPREPDKLTVVRGKVVAVAKDANTITLEVLPQGRGEVAKKVDIKITPKTVITYGGVGPNGARPTEGYDAQARLDEGSKDTAASVTFSGQADVRRARPSAGGKVTAVAGNGKGITLEIMGRGRGEPGKTLAVPIDDKTLVTYSGISADGARPTVGYDAQVWLEEGGRPGAAVKVSFRGTEPQEGRNAKQADGGGSLVSVSADGKQLIVELPREARGEEPKQMTVHITDKTKIVYHSVGPDGAKPAKGYRVQVWLEDGSKAAALRVSFMGVTRENTADISGKVVGVQEGKSITLEQPSQARGEEPKRIEVKISDKTKSAYYGVGPDGARPTEGYLAQVWLEAGSKDTAAQLILSHAREGRGR